MIKVLFNTISQFVGKAITAGSTLLITILIAREYGAIGFGEFTKIMTYATLFYLFIDFGFNAVVLREMNENEKDSTNLYRSLFGLRIITSLILVFFAISLISFFPYNETLGSGYSPIAKLGIIIASLTIITQGLFITANTLFQKNERYDKSVIASSLGSALTVIFVFLIVRYHYPLILTIGSYVVGGAVTATAALLFAGRYAETSTPLFNAKKSLSIIIKTIPLAMILICSLIYFRIDIFMLSFMKPTKDVGIYGYAYKFFEFALTFPIFFMNSLYPSLLKKYSENKIEFKKAINQSTTLLLGGSLLASVIGIIAAPLIVIFLGKSEFIDSVTPLRILFLFLPVYFLTPLYMWTLVTMKKEKILITVYIISTITNGLLNYMLIPQYSYFASAWLTGISETGILFATLYLVNKQLKKEEK